MTAVGFGSVWLQLLGEVRVRCDGRILKLGGPKPRAILAALAARANEPVHTDRLITAVWGPEAGITRDTLYHYIHDLRTSLVPAAPSVVLEGLRPNYRLVVAEPERVIDWYRFCDLVD